MHQRRDICSKFQYVLKLYVLISIYILGRANSVVEEVYEIISDIKINDKYIESVKPEITKFDCVLLCHKNILCKTVSYDFKSRACITSYNNALPLHSDIQKGWISFRKLRDTVSQTITTSSSTTLETTSVPSQGSTLITTSTTNLTTLTEIPPTDCVDVLNSVGATTSGVYTVYIPNLSAWASVYCELKTDGGGWTAFQRRHNGITDFNKGFDLYRNGFGDASAEFWLGLDILYAMTNGPQNELRIEFTDFNGDLAYEQYDQFNIGTGPLYQLMLGDATFFNTTQDTADTGTPGSSQDMDQTEICQFMNQTLGFSTEWNDGDYSADQVLGTPDVFPAYGDKAGAWCPGNNKTSTDYLEYRFSTPIRITNVTVYETYEVGSLTRIASRDLTGQWVTLWSTATVVKLTESRLFSPNITIKNLLTSDIRLEMDLTNSWYEIDAIQVCGSTNINPFQTMKYNDGMGFSTMDNDVDLSSGNCANLHKGGWWFDDCTSINPNGEYTPTGSVASNNGLGGMIVPGWKGMNTVQSSKLMFRRKPST